MYLYINKDKQIMKAKDQYGETVTIFEIVENVCVTDKGFYHVTKLFINGKSVQPN